MYDLSLVKKKKRNRRVAIVSGIGAAGVTALVIVSFLGQNVGTFTVNLKNEGVSLTMDTSSKFDKPTSYLNASGFGKITGQFSYPWFVSSTKYSFDKIDSEETTYELGNGANDEGLKFFKYTFFIKNDGLSNASYAMDINLLENTKPTNGPSLDYYLRLMVFEEGNDPRVFARRSNTRDDENNAYAKEYVCGLPGTNTYYGEAEIFPDENRLATIENYLEPEGIRRYTILLWLEGSDPECTTPPDRASLRIGATINAYPQSK